MTDTMNFRDLAASVEGVNVPDIQRDYAQGRTTKRVVALRKDFVATLLRWLADEQKHQLDFVYGYRDSKCRFVPLDGQQRLTTLLLLHLILGARTGNECQYHFRYETRDSSTRFCDALITHHMHVLATADKPSEAVRDAAWYHNAWDLDPTTQGMLVMLDEIHRQTSRMTSEKMAQCYAGLDRLCFFYKDLKDYVHPDDLFIKMNARGLPLTDYEIFKGKLEKAYRLRAEKETYRNLRQHIDADWADTLWRMYYDDNKPVDLSPCWEHLIARLIALYALRTVPKSEKVNREKIAHRNNKSLPFLFTRYEDCGVRFDAPLLQKLYDALDGLLGKAGDKAPTLRYDVRQALQAATATPLQKATYADLVKLYAYLEWRLALPGEGLEQWMRLVYNLLSAKSVNSVDELADALDALDVALQGITKADGNVLQWLAHDDCHIGAPFEQEQVAEECRKARLAQANAEWLHAIVDAEQDKYMDGQIGYLLDYADCDIERFRNGYVPKAKALWAKVDQVVADFSLVRAMCSRGDYMPRWGDWNDRCNTCNSKGGYYSWRSQLHKNPAARQCMKEIFDSPDYETADVQASLVAIAGKPTSDFERPWQRVLCTDRVKHYLRGSGNIFDSGAHVAVLNKAQLNGYQWDFNALELADKLIATHPEKVIETQPARNSCSPTCVCYKFGAEHKLALLMAHMEGQWHSEVKCEGTSDDKSTEYPDLPTAADSDTLLLQANDFIVAHP